LEKWSAESQRRAAEDLAFLPKSSPVFDLLASAYRLRDEVQACNDNSEGDGEPTS